MNTTRTVLVAVAAITLAVIAFQALSFAVPQPAWAQGSMMGNGPVQGNGNGCPHMNGQGMMGQGMMNGCMMGMGAQQQMMNGQHMMNGQNHQQCQQYMNNGPTNPQQCQTMQQYCQP